MGNQASDLDSMVAAVVYSLFLQTLSKSPTIRYAPVLNIPRKHFGLRGEAPGAFSSAGIDINSVTFVDEIDLKELSSSKLVDVVMVDHNKLAESQKFLGPCIKGIIDHHKNEHLYESTSSFRHIKTIGSACSLVALQALEQAPEIITPEVATLLTSVILLDTSNMSPEVKKGTATDAEALEKLEKAGGTKSSEYKALYAKLLQQRNDISKFNSAQLLLKDTKFGVAGGVHYAICAVPLCLLQWVKKYHDFKSAVQGFIKEKGLDACLIMTMYTENGNFKRQLLSWTKSKEMSHNLHNELTRSDLELKHLKLNHGMDKDLVSAYQQHNVKSSRKQVMPLVDKFFSKKGCTENDGNNGNSK